MPQQNVVIRFPFFGTVKTVPCCNAFYDYKKWARELRAHFLFFNLDYAVFFFKIADTLFNKLFNLFVFGSAFIFGNIAEEFSEFLK